MCTHSGEYACLFAVAARALLTQVVNRLTPHRDCRVLVLGGLLALVFAPVFGQTLPGAATPGGALPEIPDTDFSIPASPDELFPIPPVIDRPLGVEDGERLFVAKFLLKGTIDRPDLGILKADLRKMLEESRVLTQGLDKVGPDGFTDEERQEIAAFMRVVVEDPEWDNQLADYEVLVDRLREERLDRDTGMTIGQMQDVANAVTQYYRNAGFVLAQAFIPAQEVADGVVTIEVLEGTLGNVLAEGNKNFPDEVLAAPFQDLIDSPVTASSIESSILLLSDLAGLGVFGVFQPGQEVGTSDLILKVQKEKTWEATARYDNHGTRFTGENRVFTELTLNNMARRGDRLSWTMLQQYNPKKSFFGSLKYERPIFIPGLSVTALYSRNFFDVGAELRELNVGGVSKTGTAFLKYAVSRSRQKNLYVQVGASRKQAVTKVNRGVVARDDLSMFEGSVTFDLIDPETRSINIGSLGVVVGLNDWLGGMGDSDSVTLRQIPPTRTTGSGKFAANTFNKVIGSFSRIQNLYDSLSAILRLEGQWSPSILTSTEQYHIGGPSNLRAYPPSEFLMDSAFLARSSSRLMSRVLPRPRYHSKTSTGVTYCTLRFLPIMPTALFIHPALPMRLRCRWVVWAWV